MVLLMLATDNGIEKVSNCDVTKVGNNHCLFVVVLSVVLPNTAACLLSLSVVISCFHAKTARSCVYQLPVNA